MKHKIICGDAIEELKKLSDNSIDACVTDPPYELNFMNRSWDRSGIAFNVELWQELYRVLKPGAHILVAGIARTHHRMWVALEDAGFSIKDGVYHIFSSGFPKSTDISKQLDKMAGKEREIIEINPKWNTEPRAMQPGGGCRMAVPGYTIPVTESAKYWNGFGTAIKPAVEIWCLAQKAISECNIASNVLRWGCGGINVNGCRVKYQNKTDYNNSVRIGFLDDMRGGKFGNSIGKVRTELGKVVETNEKGRFPSNLILSHGEECEELNCSPNCVCRMLDEQGGILTSGALLKHHNQKESENMCMSGKNYERNPNKDFHANIGYCSRFFYQAKASQNERYFYCTLCKQAYQMKERDNHVHNAPENEKYKYLVFHPTVKPLQLIQYFVRLVTPSNGIVLDPFMGTGTTLVAAEKEGFSSINIDSKLEYCKIAERRLNDEMRQLRMDRKPSTIEKIGF